MRHLSLLSFALLSVGIVPHARAAGTCDTADIRWVGTSNRLYVTGDARCTLTDLKRLAPDAPLTQVDATNKIWLLEGNILLEQGAHLILDGSSYGDVAELRLKSDRSSYVEVRAQWGAITIRKTRITSWDGDGPDTKTEDGRALLRAISYLDTDGTTARESRMDVLDSEIAYLGHYAAESYGLVWKVRGETEGIFDKVNVYGDIRNSTVHHNYFGMYSFGAYGMVISDNEFHDNVMYGVDPHDDSDALVVENNYIHHNGNHGFICSKRCDNLVVRDNVSSFNALAGYMFHRDVRDSVLENNLAESNGDAGIAVMDAHQNVIRNNTAVGNKYGIRFSVGASENIAEGNVLTDNTLYGIYFYQGSDPPTINDGRVANNVFRANQVSGSPTGIKAADAVANEFVENVLRDTSDLVADLYDTEDNVFRANDLGGGHLFIKGASSDIIADAELAQVELGSKDARMTFTDARGRVFQSVAAVPTQIDADGASMTLTEADCSGVTEVSTLPLAVSAEGGDVTVTVTTWEGGHRTWTTKPGKARRARFVTGALIPGARYLLSIDGAAKESLVADANGEVAFSANVDAAHTFVLSSSRILPPPVWTFDDDGPATTSSTPRPVLQP